MVRERKALIHCGEVTPTTVIASVAFSRDRDEHLEKVTNMLVSHGIQDLPAAATATEGEGYKPVGSFL